MDDPLHALREYRRVLVDQRRSLASSLDVASGHAFREIQAQIEALDRAIMDEMALFSPGKRSDIDFELTEPRETRS